MDGPLEAEVGTSVILNCTFQIHDDEFVPKSVTWTKCNESKIICPDSDMIFHSDECDDTLRPVQDEFKGRVSLLEPDITQKNASIVIRDLRVSDTGSYQLVAYGSRNGEPWWTSFRLKKPITATGMMYC